PAEAQDGAYLFNDEAGLADPLPLAKVDAACGDAAYRWLSQAISWAKAKQVDAIVTAPLHKVAMNQAGHHFAGHTEILAEQTNTEEFSLMLIAGGFRVVHVTCHVAMKDVSSMLTQERIAMTIRLFNQALSRLDGKPPRIAVCAYNPHAGEEGLFGREEIDAIAPAVDQCKRGGVDACGPYPSDSIFPQLLGGKFDGVVAMYHDQGHIPFKTTNFGFDPDKGEWETVTGVNVTLGLPIIRTSVDHGTAFDLAGTGKASERSLLDAIDVAIRLAR
ncbi:4-hydroxythreonine-4-phosphate dehydrogenase PdxA, partial [bacterium]|nr:4-hydroxythreonine-4-phosphate dehydrogenase PdxA [bacterium]